MIRLRQVAMIAPDLDPVVDELRRTFGLQVCFHDPGVAEFGLRNALLLVGDQFIEVLSPIRESEAWHKARELSAGLVEELFRATTQAVKDATAPDEPTLRRIA